MEKNTTWKHYSKKARVSVLILDKVDFKISIISVDKKGTFLNHKAVNSPWGHTNPKYEFTQQQSFKIHEDMWNLVELKDKKDQSAVIVGGIHLISVIARTSR